MSATLPASILAALEPTPDAALLLDIDALATLMGRMDVARGRGERAHKKAIGDHCHEFVALQRQIATTRAQTPAGARAKLEAAMLGQKPDSDCGSMFALPNSAIADALRLLA